MRFTLRPNRALMTELETPRFILRPVHMLDLVGDPYGWRRMPRIYRDLYLERAPMSFGTWVKRGPFPDQVRRFTSAIVPKGQQKAIGFHMVTLSGPHNASNTVGIHDEAWLGKDVAVEARAKIMNHFFRNGIRRFSGRVASTNTASIFTYRKLGYAHVGTTHAEKQHPETGAPIDFVLFEALKDDWKRSPYAEPGL